MTEATEPKSDHELFWRVTWSMLLVAILTVSAIVFYPEWRVRWQAWLLPEKKDLLATVSGALLGDGTEYKVLKFATRRGLIVEVHAQNSGAHQPFVFIDRIFIPDRHDGYFSLNTAATQLAMVDMDGDGRLEILAPSFDEKLVAHLNTLRLDPDSKRLELVKPPPAVE